MRLIDAHVHVTERIKGFGFSGEFRPVGGGKIVTDVGAEVQMFPPSFGDKGVLAEDFLAFMDAQGIERAVMLQGPAYGYQNQYLYEVGKRYPDRLLPSAFIDPEIALFDAVLENLTERLGLRIFKLEMSTVGGIMGCHAGNTMQHPNMDKLFAAVESVRGTIALDIGGPEETSYQIDRVVQLAKAYPQLRIVMCHLLEPERDDDDRLAENLKKLALPNVWFDISSLPTILDEMPPYEMTRRYLRLAKGIVTADRLIWGTDSPGALVKHDYKQLLNLLVAENGDFTASEKEAILYHNALSAYPFV